MTYIYSIPNHTRNNSPAKLFYLSHSRVVRRLCVFCVVARYVTGKKMTIRLQNTPNSSPTAHISDTSRDTTSFAINNRNIVLR